MCRAGTYRAFLPAWQHVVVALIPAEVGLAYCNKLFFLEKQFRDLTPEERKDRRLEIEVPVWESFYAWLEQLNPVKRSKLEKAVIYAKNHKETLRNYLQDGRCEISNNTAERRAKSYAIGRKAFFTHRLPGQKPALSCTVS